MTERHDWSLRPKCVAIHTLRSPTSAGGSLNANALGGIAMFFFREGFTYRNFLTDVLSIFIFIMWFWLLISITSDLFRRHDISGWGKALWIIALILLPYIGVFVYLISQGRGMAERNIQQEQAAREEIRRVVGFSVADEIDKLDRLRKAGSISDAEFTRLRAQLIR
ncbi:MAG: SHOCT domain-containing protein [Pseudomonadota bacterium]